eukprot:m.22060 g.22060  ORF g.22060 m.22060 type:complete len:133 (-) comp3952_c0_seq1:1606-2004(-)
MAEGTYTPSPLARLIHQTPRITFHFNAASAVFDPESRNYEEGLASIAIVFLTFGIFLFLLMTYTVCCSGEVGDEAKTVYRPATVRTHDTDDILITHIHARTRDGFLTDHSPRTTRTHTLRVLLHDVHGWCYV